MTSKKILINETIISIPLINNNKYAYDSFITDKRKIHTYENTSAHPG